MPTRGFTAAVSVFRGTPPEKPLNCKIRFVGVSGGFFHWRGQLVGDESRVVFDGINLPLEDINWMWLGIGS